MIPVEAVEALASVLAHESLVKADMDGYGWDARTDSLEPFMPRARERARAYLDAACSGLMMWQYVNDGKQGGESMIPPEALEAAHRAWREQAALDGSIFEYNLRAALKAAAPILLSHEREQTRLAHLDAMVNRETKRQELAEAWEEGYMCSYDQERGGHGQGPIPVPEHLKEDFTHWNPYRE